MSINTPTNSKLLNQKQVAEMIGFSESWLERMRWAGGGIPYVKIGRTVRYSESDVNTWVESYGKRTSTSAMPQKA